jgi:hypothetical protein
VSTFLERSVGLALHCVVTLKHNLNFYKPMSCIMSFARIFLFWFLATEGSTGDFIQYKVDQDRWNISVDIELQVLLSH